MLLSGVLFVLFLAGCWLYCVTDAALTPAREFQGLSKAAWIGIICATFIVGAAAWLMVRRSWRTTAWTSSQAGRPTPASQGDTDATPLEEWTAADDAIARHPAGRSIKTTDSGAAPKGPDDDLPFLRELARQIRGTSADAGD